MKGGEGTIAYIVAFLWIACFFRVVFINLNVIKYLKNNHKKFWENNFQLFGGVGKGGPNIFQYLDGLNDSEIDSYKNKWAIAIKQLFFVIIVSSCLIAAYIFWLVKK